MADTYKILAKKASGGTFENVLYSTSAGKEAIVTNITVANRTSSNKTFDIHVVDSLLTNGSLTGEETFSGTKTIYTEGTDLYTPTGTYKQSTDGTTWTTGTMPRVDDWVSFNHIGSAYLAFNANPGNSVDYAYSSDAITWNTMYLPHPFNMQYAPVKKFNDKIWISPGMDNDTFAALSTVYSSTDGYNWTSATLPNVNAFSYNIMRTLDYGNNTYFGTSAEASYGFSSTDGITWSQWSVPEVCNFSTSAFVNSMANGPTFVASGVDDAYVAPMLYTSTDCITWTQQIHPSTSYFSTMVSNGSKLVAMTSTEIWESSDGINWSLSTVPFIPDMMVPMRLRQGEGTFILHQLDLGMVPPAEFYTSTDGTSWTTNMIPDTSKFARYFSRFFATDYTEYATDPVHTLYKDVLVAGNTSKVLEPGIVLGPENTILNRGEVGLTFSAYGVELS